MRVLVAIPALNEEQVIGGTIDAVVRAFRERPELSGHQATIVVADNGSTDRTAEIVRERASRYANVRLVATPRRGKGLAIRAAWASGSADAYAFMDADLAVDLSALGPMLDALGPKANVVAGSRFHPASSVSRSLGRRLASRTYRMLLWTLFRTSLKDIACGFKAVTPAVVREIVPKVRDDRWFFDTELVIRAEHAGLGVRDVPVRWRDRSASGGTTKVNVVSVGAEYLRQCVRLRRELGGPRDPDRRTICRLSVAAIALTSIVPVHGLVLAAVAGTEWNGVTFLAPGDHGAYLSYIIQAKDGAALFQNLFTTEALTPVWNWFWGAVGVVAAAFRIAPLAAFHLVRILLIPLFVRISFRLASVFLPERNGRILGTSVFLFGSGVGLLIAPFLHRSTLSLSTQEWPIDLWVGESNAFLSMLTRPHFVASWCLFLLTFLLILRAFEGRRVRDALLAGASACALIAFHPYHAPTLYAVPGVFLAIGLLERRFVSRHVALYAAYVLLSIPALLYHVALYAGGGSADHLQTQNYTYTPSPLLVAAGFGACSVLFAIGYVIGRRRERIPSRWDFLLVWTVVQSMLVYSGISFERRMLEGLQFPLVMLSVPALLAAYRWFGRKIGDATLAAILAGMIGAFVFLPSSVSAIAEGIAFHKDGRTGYAFFSREQSDALRWIRERTPEDAIFLSHLDTGNLLPGWTDRRVYAGHWALTLDLQRKIDEVARFYEGTGGAPCGEFLRNAGIDYVYWGPRERAFGGDIRSCRSLESVFREGPVEIFKVKE